MVSSVKAVYGLCLHQSQDCRHEQGTYSSIKVNSVIGIAVYYQHNFSRWHGSTLSTDSLSRLFTFCYCDVMWLQGKEDEMMVLTTTPHSAVDSVSIDEVPPVMSSLGRASPNQRQEGEEEEEAVVSLLRKKSRTEVDGDNQASCALEAFSRKCAIQPPVNPVSQNTALLSYKVSQTCHSACNVCSPDPTAGCDN